MSKSILGHICFGTGAAYAVMRNIGSNLTVDIPVDKIKEDLKAGISETNAAIEDRRLTRLAESQIREQLNESAKEQHQQIVEIVKQELLKQQSK